MSKAKKEFKSVDEYLAHQQKKRKAFRKKLEAIKSEKPQEDPAGDSDPEGDPEGND